MSLVPDWVPEADRDVDTSDLRVVEPELAAQVTALERRLAVHVAVYRRGASGSRGGLCHRFCASTSSRKEMDALRLLESRHDDVTLVAYARPLRRLTDRTDDVGGVAPCV